MKTYSMDSSKTWKEILDFIATITPYISIVAILWKGIDKLSEYFSATRDAELREIVKQEMRPQISHLSDKVEELSKSIWALNSKISGK